MYSNFQKLSNAYSLLQDDESREIFWARIRHDVEQSEESLRKLAAWTSLPDASMIFLKEMASDVKSLGERISEYPRLIIYGTATWGLNIADRLRAAQIPYYGFCGRRAKAFTQGLYGKPVVSPEWLLENRDSVHVIICANRSNYLEIEGFLKDNGFPSERILPYFKRVFLGELEGGENEKTAPNEAHCKRQQEIKGRRQYFDFPELFPKGTAFVDGGSYNCDDSFYFANWCGGEYSTIFIFEPDPINFERCRQRVFDEKLRGAVCYEAGLSEKEGSAGFVSFSSYGSHFASENTIYGNDMKRDASEITTVKTVAIDEVVKGQTVGFIKMDIEGFEYGALRGASRTICRDKPFLAISVYHVAGDLPAIITLLNEMVPEYRFWLRHYSDGKTETVLYASL